MGASHEWLRTRQRPNYGVLKIAKENEWVHICIEPQVATNKTSCGVLKIDMKKSEWLHVRS
jgi:hypothetical protein